MENKVVLSKSSDNDEIKAYFLEVSKLSKSKEEFPVDFDQVWMLVYTYKHKAIKELRDKFIESVDYKAVTGKVECRNGIGSSRVVKYYITIPCLEFFIARKVRTVFEVYRQVFHKTIANLTLPNFEDPVEAALAWAEEYKQKQLALQKIEEAQPAIDYYDNMVEGRDYFSTSSIANELKTSPQKLNQFLSKRIGNGKKGYMVKVDDKHRSWQCEPKISFGQGVLLRKLRWTKEGRIGIIALWKSLKCN